MSSMYAIVDEAQEIAELYAELQAKTDADDCGITEDEQCAALVAWFGENQAAFKGKVDGYVAVIREYQGMEQAAKDEAKRLTSRAKSHAGHVSRLKDVLKHAMITLDVDKAKTACNTVTLATNPATPYTLNENLLPKEYLQTKTTANKTAIAAALREGTEIEGVTTHDKTKSLRIL